MCKLCDDDAMYGHLGNQPLKIVHVIGPLEEPVCPKCGSLHEDKGGDIIKRGSWDWGPFYWECGACGEQWGHA